MLKIVLVAFISIKVSKCEIKLLIKQNSKHNQTQKLYVIFWWYKLN